jgi:predicted Zn-dependent protease
VAAGRLDEAIAIYEALLKTSPNDPTLILNLAVVEFKARRYEQVIDRCKRALELKPDLTPALLFLGASYFQMGKPGEAAGPLGRVVESQPGERNARLMLAESLLLLEQYREAATHFNQLSGALADNPRVWYGLERSYHMLAALAAEKLDRSAPDSAFTYALAGDNFHRTGQYGRAIHWYRKALESGARIGGINASLARAYKAAGHPEWAGGEYEKEGELPAEMALSTDNSPEALYDRARAANEFSARAYDKLAALPPSPELHELTARRLDGRGRHLEAAKEWREALRLAPDNAVVQNGLALSLYNGRDLDGALSMLEALLKREPDSAELQFLMGRTLLEMEQPANSVRFFEAALQRNPELMQARGALGEAHLKLGEAKEAIPHLEAALSSDEDGSRHFQLARAYQATGAHELAGKALEQYRQLRGRWETKRREVEADFPVRSP